MKGLTMTRRSRKNQRRVIASILTGMFIVQQTMTLTVCASEISGITSGGHGTFNITPEKIDGSTGFRHYEKFNLDKGDIANLNYANIENFVNMVDNQININGIVNTMRGSGFYNGKAIFVSPNGMVVGASGVLNVGSLGVYTPGQSSYNTLVKAQTEGALKGAMTPGSNAPITINGKIIASGDVILKGGGNINIGSQGGIAAGVNRTVANGANTAFTTEEQATNLFNNLVNTDNLTTGSSFASKNGRIEITANQNDGTPIGVTVAGKLVNYNTETATETKTYDNGTFTVDVPNIKIQNNGNNGITITDTGLVANNKGLVDIKNNSGNLTIAGTVRNNGTTQIFNTPATANENTGYTSDINSKLTISGNINTQGNLNINNTGTEGMYISGNVNHAGDLNILNGIEGNTNAAITRNAAMQEMNISGNITNTNGNTTITNYAAGGMNVTNTGNINTNGSLAMLNTGAGGLTINGTAVNNGTANVTNKAGALNIGGSFTNTGNATILNDGTQLNVSGTVTNKNGTLDMTNNGAGGFYVTDTGSVDAQGLNMTNNGAGGLNINGNIVNNGAGNYKNNAGAFNVGGKIVNNGTGYYYNQGDGGLNINGTIENQGQADVINKAGALNVAGTFSNVGNTNMTNDGTTFDVSGTVQNRNGKLVMTNNNNGGLNIKTGGNVDAQGLEMVNFGPDGLNIDGTVTNTNGAVITNHGAGGLNVRGTVTNSGNANVTNNAGALNVAGTFNNTGNADFTNNGTNFTVDGTITNKDGTLAMLNQNGALNINQTGLVSNTGNTTITNNGTNGLNVHGNITNGGTLDMTNTGAEGLNVTGNVSSNGDICLLYTSPSPRD